MKLVIFLFAVLVTANQSLSEKVRYDGYQVYRLTPKSQEAVDYLRILEDNQAEYDFWTGVRGVGFSVDIMVPPYFKDVFNSTRSSELFEAEIFISDVQKLIDNEQPKSAKYRSIAPRALDWGMYHELDVINQFLTDLEAEFADNSNVNVIVEEIGRSYEERPINAIKISFDEAKPERTVFIESNIHAREWITSAVTTWVINEILTSEDSEVRRVVESVDWIIVPVANPDGFVYSHREERMWRKTRTPYFFCYGADPNRNWAHHFNEGGTSANPCALTYPGPQAFSEPSTNSLSEYLGQSNVGPNLRAYLAIHSYSQMLLLPYGNSNEKLDNYDDLLSVGLKAADKLKERYGTEYSVGNIVDLLYVASGGSMDWVKATFRTPITYTYELRDKGEFGFILPAEQIIPCAEETFDSIVAILDEFDILENSRKI